MNISADLVLRAGSTATLHANGRIMASGYDLLPCSRVYLPNSRAIVRVTANANGHTEAIREEDGYSCLLRRLELYEVVTR